MFWCIVLRCILLFALYVCPMIVPSRRIIVRRLKNQEFQVSKSWRAVRVAFRWKKASDPNHLSVYAYLQEYYDDLIGTWRTTQENRTTTILMGSGLGWVIRWTICCVGVVPLGGYEFVLWTGWRKLRLLRDRTAGTNTYI